MLRIFRTPLTPILSHFLTIDLYRNKRECQPILSVDLYRIKRECRIGSLHELVKRLSQCRACAPSMIQLFHRNHIVSHPPLLISASNFRAIMVGMPCCNHTFLYKASYRFWFRKSCRPRLNPLSGSPYLSRYGAWLKLPFCLWR